jgi:hypothetical protein
MAQQGIAPSNGSGDMGANSAPSTPPRPPPADAAHRAHPSLPMGTVEWQPELLSGDIESGGPQGQKGEAHLPNSIVESLLPASDDTVVLAVAGGDNGKPDDDTNWPQLEAEPLAGAKAAGEEPIPRDPWWVARLAGRWPEARKGVKYQLDENLRSVLLALTIQAACATVVTALGSWVSSLVYFVLVACLSCALVRQLIIETAGLDPDKIDPEKAALFRNFDQESWAVLVMWFWSVVLVVVPAMLFASATMDSGAVGWAGVAVFAVALWTLGWAFLWYCGYSMRPIKQGQHLWSMPPYRTALLRLKLLAVAFECYNYCGLFYSQALPWKSMRVPVSVPHPQVLMLAGFLDGFGNVGIRVWAFVGAVAMVLLSFALLGVARYKKDPARQLLVLQVFFDLLSFPVAKNLSSVFSCTSASVWIPDENEQGRMLRFCNEKFVPIAGQCMDINPDVACWTGEHRGYIAVVLFLLVPFYFTALHQQTLAHAEQSVVIIDGGWNVVSTQSKFLLAITASIFGNCFPIVTLVSVMAVVLGQLWMLRRTVYSNVHSLNSIRNGGLMTAGCNGLYATFILCYYRYYLDDPAGALPCDVSSTTSFSVTGQSETNDYNILFGLLAANVVTLTLGEF